MMVLGGPPLSPRLPSTDNLTIRALAPELSPAVTFLSFTFFFQGFGAGIMSGCDFSGGAKTEEDNGDALRSRQVQFVADGLRR